MADAELEWGKHDSFVVPNWTWHRLINSSRLEPAILFSMNDRPILDAFGLYREEKENSPLAPQLPVKTFVRPAAE